MQNSDPLSDLKRPARRPSRNTDLAPSADAGAQRTASKESRFKRGLDGLEQVLFRWRKAILVLLLAFTAVMGWFALKLHMEAGFEKQMPLSHEYVKTFQTYRNDVLGANRLNIVVKARSGKGDTP